MAASSYPIAIRDANINIFPSISMLDALGLRPKIKLDNPDRVKLPQELCNPQEPIVGDPEKICRLIELALSFFAGNNGHVVVLRTEGSITVLTALHMAVHILFTPWERLPECTKEIFKRIKDQIAAEPPRSLAFSLRDIKEIQRILIAGKWTFMQFMELRQPEDRKPEDFFGIFPYPAITHRLLALPSPNPPNVNTPLINPPIPTPPTRKWYMIPFTCGLSRQKGAKVPAVETSEAPSLTPGSPKLFWKGKQPTETQDQKSYAEIQKALTQKTNELERLKVCWERALVYIRDYQQIRYREIESRITESRSAASQRDLYQATIKRCQEELEKCQLDNEKIKSSSASNLANSLKEVARWRAETDNMSKELTSALEFRNQQQERHERESAEKDSELRKANLAVKTARKELLQVQKQAEKKIQNSASALADLKTQMEAKDIELGMLARRNAELETKTAALDAQNIASKTELEELRKAKESFETEKARYLAFRTNPEAEKDRTEKAVELAVQDAVAVKDSKLQFLEKQLDSFEEGRVIDQNTIRELLGDKYRLKEKVKDDELYQAGLEGRVCNLEQEVATWQQYFYDLTQPSKVKFLNPEAADWKP